MEKQLSSHDFKEVYEREGIDLTKLGCVMLDTQPLRKPAMYDFEIPEAFYKSPNPDMFWIDGYVADKTPHVSLLYGLMTPAYEQPENIEAVMEGWSMPEVTIKEFGYFPSTMKEEPYFCIIGHVEVTPKLLEAHHRLSFLPHINTFAGYKPHVTVAYVVNDEGIRDRIVNDMNKLYAGIKLSTKSELNLGSAK